MHTNVDTKMLILDICKKKSCVTSSSHSSEFVDMGVGCMKLHVDYLCANPSSLNINNTGCFSADPIQYVT